jgi:FKBP-type peptidyl-prolyl cis-trans isomerase
MPPVTILSPYSGRPVKLREQDLGRALRDEQGRVFYVVEDPEHGRYAARTRKGSPKDLERYREIEAGVAKLEDGPTTNEAPLSSVHDATGAKRRNPVGLLIVLLVFAAAVAAGYVYINHPEWLGLDSDTESQTTPPTPDSPGTEAGDEQAETPSVERSIVPVAQRLQPRDTEAIEPIDPTAPGIAAAPLRDLQVDAPPRVIAVTNNALPDGMDDDPEPVFVPAVVATLSATNEDDANEAHATTRPNAERDDPGAEDAGDAVPIALPPSPADPPRPPRDLDYDDFRHNASGLRYKITHLTDGVSARAGNYLTVRYTAQTLDGRPLIDDASQSFILASGQAIRAFDEGLAGIREGEQLRLLVPRGHSDTGTLPGVERLPDEPFLMDVQLVAVQPGVTYIIETPGDPDARPAQPGDAIDLHYLARVEGREEVIDTTVARGQPMRITLGKGEVIEGLELGITGMRPGESRQLTIPPYLAYGRYSVAGGLIPENAVLSFRVTLVQIVANDE